MTDDVNIDQFVGVRMDAAAVWLCGYSHFPAIAEPLIAAGTELNGIGAIEGEAFSRPTTYPGGGTASSGGPAFAAWSAVRTGFQTILRESVENLYEAGDALIIAAHSFDQQDEENGGQLDDIHRSMEDHYELVAPEDRQLPPEPGAPIVDDQPHQRPGASDGDQMAV
ncbi:hypothetical protein FB566_3695 [Stackebrandtia endophytica]|uniref:Uncharacterized protein n=1 Tax=Stackebrandtia endophytica TaxID=1496996 RepID=A0A543AZW5_9ACTN|nr:hypothetical protein [Stackebrandtia endophytica]TQL78118.1 hypothetical protein FB566_3695 [Stackebrandtia endophytica]